MVAMSWIVTDSRPGGDKSVWEMWRERMNARMVSFAPRPVRRWRVSRWPDEKLRSWWRVRRVSSERRVLNFRGSCY